ncbi:hypothetical protein QAD02_024186 [Eretmocerus hayati]|uniref:Uncharacterized protein n=1 Tax=Eretmocerus hayati TaxID=131215 RepID=A0ACC2Q065_9HYME|nr:hypothetical protein QAD02_024186 [Eretmocerus hayati]
MDGSMRALMIVSEEVVDTAIAAKLLEANSYDPSYEQNSYYRRPGQTRYTAPPQNQYNPQQQQSSYKQQQNSYTQEQGDYNAYYGNNDGPQQQQQQQQQQQRARNLQTNSVLSSPSFSSSGLCPEANGRFPVASQCDAYIECKDGQPEQKLCPEGLLFNPEARFNYPCGYPTDVQCLTRSNLQPAQPTDDCPHQFGYFKMGDRQNCGKFKNCVDGRAYVFDCPDGLAYNSETYRCDWPDQVADCDAEAFLGFTCPTSNFNGQSVSETKIYRSPHDCQRYYVCVENRPRLHSCGEGKAFNEIIGACDGAENVTGCEPPGFARQEFTPVSLNEPQLDVRFSSQPRTFNQQQNLFKRQNPGSSSQQLENEEPKGNQAKYQQSRQRFSSFQGK